MSHLFKLMRENVSDSPLETSRESVAINEELDRIKKEEAFYSKLIASIAQVNKTIQANVEAELALWELLRLKGTEWKDQDFDQGAAVCKTVQACNVVETHRLKSSDAAIKALETRLERWSRDEVKSAKMIGEAYSKLHRAYSNSSHKVHQINRDKKVQLSDLAAAEKKRDDLFSEWEREGRVGLQSLQHIVDKSKSTLMQSLSEYVQSKLDSYQAAVMTLTKVQTHLNELVSFADSQEALQKSSVKQLQSTIESEEQRQRELDNAPRSLHKSLLSETDALQLYMSRCSLSHSWEAKRDGKSKTTVGFDIRTSGMTIGDSSWHVDEVLTLTKGHKSDSTKIKISFQNRDYKEESLTFFSSKDREAFYELFCLLRRGLGNSFVASDSRPVTHEEIRVWTGSFNLGDAPPDFNCESGMEAWMPRNKYDFYVLALQESEYTPRSGYLTAEDDFFSFMRHHLGDDYMKLAGVSLTHIRLVCFVCRDHYHKISSVKTATVATGLAGVIGNKGGCAISFNFYDARFCFVGAHLAARIDKKRLEARNQNYRDILKGLANGFSKNGLSDIHHEFDYLVWVGDLNYRIDGLSRDEIIAKAASRDYQYLLKHDQLNNERAIQNCFLECEEPSIDFGPTYRFNRGDRTWSEEKMREPAYCDRVLYKTIPKDAFKPLDYAPCHLLMTSDHSPIYSTFSVAVYLPSMPHVRDPMCRVTIKDVTGIDLKMQSGRNGGQYSLILQAPWISSPLTTSASGEPESPKWPNEMTLYPISTNRTYLASRWIRAVIRDGKQDVGQGIIYLADAVAKRNSEIVRFTCNLADKGRFAGKLTGTIQVSFSNSYEEPWPFNPTPGILPSYYNLTSPPSLRNTLASSVRHTIGEGEYEIKAKQSEHVHLGGDEEHQNQANQAQRIQNQTHQNQTHQNQTHQNQLPQKNHENNNSSNLSSSGSSNAAPGSAPKSIGRSWASSRSPTSRTPPMPISVSGGTSATGGASKTSNTQYANSPTTTTTNLNHSSSSNQQQQSPSSSHSPLISHSSAFSPSSGSGKFMVSSPARSPAGESLIGTRQMSAKDLTGSSPGSASPSGLLSSSVGNQLSTSPNLSSSLASSGSSNGSSYSPASPRSPHQTIQSTASISSSRKLSGNESLGTSSGSLTNVTSSALDVQSNSQSNNNIAHLQSSLTNSSNLSSSILTSHQTGSFGSSGSSSVPVTFGGSPSNSPSNTHLDSSPTLASSSAFQAALSNQAPSPNYTSNPTASISVPVQQQQQQQGSTSPASIRSDWFLLNSSAPSYTIPKLDETSFDAELEALEAYISKEKPHSDPGRVLSSPTNNNSKPVSPSIYTSSSTSVSSLNSAPLIIKPSRTSGTAEDILVDDIARELAEFELLLQQDKNLSPPSSSSSSSAANR